MYNNTTNESFAKDNFWRDLSYMRKKSLEKETLFWFYYQSVGNTSTLGFITAGLIPVQAWVAIMYSAKGLQGYCASYGVIDAQGGQGSLFNDVAQMNKELLSISNTLLALKSIAVYHGSSLVCAPLADKIENSKYASSLSEFLSAGLFCDAHGNDDSDFEPEF